MLRTLSPKKGLVLFPTCWQKGIASSCTAPVLDLLVSSFSLTIQVEVLSLSASSDNARRQVPTDWTVGDRADFSHLDTDDDGIAGTSKGKIG